MRVHAPFSTRLKMLAVTNPPPSMRTLRQRYGASGGFCALVKAAMPVVKSSSQSLGVIVLRLTMLVRGKR